MKKILSISATLLFASCIQEEEPPSFEETSLLHVGDPLPTFAVRTLDGRHLTTDSLLSMQQEVTIVLFNTTCQDCCLELANLEKSYTPATLCISREQKEEDVRAYWEENHLTLPCAAVEDRSLYHLFATMYIPRIYVADRYGKITAVR